MALVFQKPFLELKNRIVKGGETLLLIKRLYTGSGFDDCGNEKRFVNIDATAGWENNFHSQNFQNKIKKPLTVPSHIYREVKTILTVRSKRATYLCLKDGTYTDYYAV